MEVSVPLYLRTIFYNKLSLQKVTICWLDGYGEMLKCTKNVTTNYWFSIPTYFLENVTAETGPTNFSCKNQSRKVLILTILHLSLVSFKIILEVKEITHHEISVLFFVTFNACTTTINEQNFCTRHIRWFCLFQRVDRFSDRTRGFTTKTSLSSIIQYYYNHTIILRTTTVCGKKKKNCQNTRNYERRPSFSSK